VKRTQAGSGFVSCQARKNDCRAVARRETPKHRSGRRFAVGLEEQLLHRPYGRGVKQFALEIFAKKRDVFRARRTMLGLDSARVALPRPPDLELQYRRMRKPCQVKNAKCGSQFSTSVYL
jgi:hypothetical protein